MQWLLICLRFVHVGAMTFGSAIFGTVLGGQQAVQAALERLLALRIPEAALVGAFTCMVLMHYGLRTAHQISRKEQKSS
jgi:hypothetical protein